MSSSCCSNLSAPFVALSYKICDSNGKAQGYTMELSFTEFQVDFHVLHGFIYKIIFSDVYLAGVFGEDERYCSSHG